MFLQCILSTALLTLTEYFCMCMSTLYGCHRNIFSIVEYELYFQLWNMNYNMDFK